MIRELIAVFLTIQTIGLVLYALGLTFDHNPVALWQVGLVAITQMAIMSLILIDGEE